MRNLLSANFMRLKKSHLFWGILALGAAFAGFRIFSLVSDQVRFDIPRYTLNQALFTYAQLVGLTIAVFTSLFLGTEYSDGAIRNKVASGCSRVSIYLAGSFTVFAASVLSLIAYWIVALAAGIPLLDPLQMSVGKALLYVLGILLMTAAFCALFTFVTMNCSHKATTAMVCVLLFFLLLVISTYVYSRLDAPEYIADYIITVDGLDMTEPVPNPRYLQPGPRKVYEFFWDLLPTGQSTQYSIGDTAHPVRLLLCSLGLTALFTGGGIALFRKKDLK